MKHNEVNWKELFIEVLKDAIQSDMMSAILFSDEIEWPDEFYEKDYDKEIDMEYRDFDYDRIWEYVNEKFKEAFGEPLYEK